MSVYAVAVDGPAGSGKSTIAKLIAKELDIVYIDTGAMYRTVALYCILNNIDTNDEKAVSEVLDNIDMEIKAEKGGQKIFLSGRDVSTEIRTQQVGNGASAVATMKDVREKLVMIQREMAKGMSVIMDGRDIGNHVLKDAKVKIYLTASADERAKRRCGEFEKLGQPYNFEDVKAQIIARDKNDMSRAINPLRKGEDAIEIDTTFMTVEEVKERIIEIIKEKACC